MGFTHFDESGHAVMVDVTEKKQTQRSARAIGTIKVNKEILNAVLNHSVQKGDVLNVARIAGIQGAKRTFELIPMCHLIMLTKCTIDFEIDEKNNAIQAICIVKTNSVTGVEMEALVGVQTALLTIYDMCKAIDKSMVITDVHLEEKTGGKSGDFQWKGK